VTAKEIPEAPERHSTRRIGMRDQTVPQKGAKMRDYCDITALIRSIQRAEGNPDCFGRAGVKCNRLDCAWRDYCLDNKQSNDREETLDGKDRDPEQSV
jgi:hypothetical protein